MLFLFFSSSSLSLTAEGRIIVEVQDIEPTLDVLSVRELERQRQRAKVTPIKPNWQIYTNAAFMDLGVCDTNLIDVLRVDPHGKD